MAPEIENTNLPSETSPLLSKNAVGATYIDQGAGIAPQGTAETSVLAQEYNGGVIERQTSDNEGRRKQFEGIPEIRKKMKYIMPALGIGVSASPLV